MSSDSAAFAIVLVRQRASGSLAARRAFKPAHTEAKLKAVFIADNNVVRPMADEERNGQWVAWV